MRPCNLISVCIFATLVAIASSSNIKRVTEATTSQAPEVTDNKDPESAEEIDTTEQQTVAIANSTHAQSTHANSTHSFVEKNPALAISSVNGPAIRKQWWEGLHVCKKVEVSKGGKAASSASATSFAIDNGDGTQSQVATQCTDSGEIYSCTIIRSDNGEIVTETTTYKCCNGYKHSERFDGRCIRSRIG